MKLWIASLAAVLLFASMDADAQRRLGGGRSFGKQSGNVTQRQATPPPPTAPGAAPAQQNAAQQQAARPAPAQGAAPAAAAQRRPWGAMLGGLAAGLGLAWLANSLGFGEALANIMLVLLFVMAAVVVIGLIMRSRRGGAGPARGMAYQGAGPADMATAPRQYSPDKVGNDASARPWERNTLAFEGARSSGGQGVQIGSALGGASNWSVPPDFDAAGFVDASKRNFMTLQDAWDRSDIATLRSMMTDEMLAEIRGQLAEREKEMAGQPNKTDVVVLEAQLLGIEDLGHGYMASVEFSGLIREDPSAGPSPFREVWNMTKPKSGASGWLVAGVQALQ